MPDFFETELRTGTAQTVDSFTPPSAAAVRKHSETRTWRRRAGAIALVLVMGGAAFGFTRPGPGHSSAPTGPTTVAATTPSPRGTTPSPRSTTPPPDGEGTLHVQLTPPARYAAATSNKVLLTVGNNGPARQVLVEFAAPGSDSHYWVEPCDSGIGGGCSAQSYTDNPLKVPTDPKLNAPGVVYFDLALPTGTSSYSAWVNPPTGLTSYTVRVLDGTTVLAQAGPESIDYGYVFPVLSKMSQGSTKLVRGGPAVEFTTEVDDRTAAAYVDLASFTTLSCEAGTTAVQVPQDAYTLEWYAGLSWQKVGAPKAPGQFGYDLKAGQSTSTRFRLSVSDAMPADVTGCRITQLVSASVTWTPPYYDQSAPSARTAVDFTVE